MSQLDLAMRAGFSARHVSFIETGRTQPSRQALLVLAETLRVPLGERNRLLEAGGFAHVYRRTPLAAEEMAHIRGVLEFIATNATPVLMRTPDNQAGIPPERAEFFRRQVLLRDYPNWMEENREPFFIPETSRQMQEWVRSMMLRTSMKALIECNRSMTSRRLSRRTAEDIGPHAPHSWRQGCVGSA